VVVSGLCSVVVEVVQGLLLVTSVVVG
jgi:hypothetical protein